MSTPVTVRFRDAFRKYVTPWMADRPGQLSGKTSTFRFLWSMIAPLDPLAEGALQGLRAAQGIGTNTALPYIGRTRGLIRGQGESDEDFVTYLSTWLDRWRAAGSAEAIAGAIQHYLANHPRVRIVTRSGYWVTLNEDGTIDRAQVAWNWDSVSHPERATFWSEIWIIVYPTQWTHRVDTYGSGKTFDGDAFGIGHGCTRVEYDAIRGLVAQWKAAHTKVRAIIWTSDSDRFDPTAPGSLPDGTWGAWGGTGSGSRTASGRDLTTCRYWEPR